MAAIIVGAGLGAATVVGIVQTSGADDNPTQPTTQVVEYGNNG
ncbi:MULTISPECIES: hypothetical protein [unclassified Mumia]|nr:MULTISPECIES: hypothetical protein [unclassified Mumia]